jgi:hypothetical protein
MKKKRHFKFRALTPLLRAQAMRMFLDACLEDGYEYELGASGAVLCRRKTPQSRLNLEELRKREEERVW